MDSTQKECNWCHKRLESTYDRQLFYSPRLCDECNSERISTIKWDHPGGNYRILDDCGPVPLKSEPVNDYSIDLRNRQTGEEHNDLSIKEAKVLLLDFPVTEILWKVRKNSTNETKGDKWETLLGYKQHTGPTSKD